jgi:hypothetical protein
MKAAQAHGMHPIDPAIDDSHYHRVLDQEIPRLSAAV